MPALLSPWFALISAVCSFLPQSSVVLLAGLYPCCDSVIF